MSMADLEMEFYQGHHLQNGEKGTVVSASKMWEFYAFASHKW